MFPMKILKAFLLILTIALSAFATERNPIDFGAVPDDGQDDSAAIQAAVNEVVEKGGGTVILPGGRLNLNDIVRIVPSEYFGGEIRIKGTRGAYIEVSTGVGGYGIYAGNLNVLSFEDVIFVGKNVPEGHADFYDARYVVFSTFIQQTNIIRCQFFGLATPGNGAVVYFGNTDGKIVDSQFDGSLGQYPDGAVVLAENSRGLTVSRTTFIDYANYIGGYLSKSTAFVGSWISVKGGLPLGGNGMRRVVIEDSRFDEAAAAAISITDVNWVSLTGNSVNVNSTSAAKGFYMKNVDHAKVEQSWLGYTTAIRPALDIENVGVLEATSLKLGGGVYFIRRKNSNNVIVKFCEQCSTRSNPL